MMPKKKNQESQKEQSDRVNKTVGDLVAAGELNPTDADSPLDRLTRKSKNTASHS